MRNNTKNLGYLESKVDLSPRSFQFSNDAVGKEYHFKFKGYHYTICMPNFKGDSIDPMQYPQPTFDNTKVRLKWIENRPLNSLHYGSVNGFDADKKISYSASQFIVRSFGPVTSVEARAMKEALISWKHQFPKWLEAILFADLNAKSLSINQPAMAESYFIKKVDNSTRRIKSRSPITINLKSNRRNLISVVDFKKALILTSSDSSPSLANELLITALKQFNKGLYRQSVLDAATAFELALTTLLDTKLQMLSTSQKHLVDLKYKQIMGLYEGLKILGEDLPTQHEVQSLIAEPRNGAIHKGGVITEDQAWTALNFVQNFIYSKIPIR